MFKVVELEPTPNPDALKFILSEPILATGVKQFNSKEAAQSDSLAQSLFSISNVVAVFYMDKFITVTKESSANWRELSLQVKQTIESHDGGLTQADASVSKQTESSNGNEELMEKINEVLDRNVRPALAGDGGGLEVMELDGYVLTINYQGACGGCPSATTGTMAAIENLLQRMVDPKIRVVQG